MELSRDIDTLSRWIGSAADAEDRLTPALLDRFNATLDLAKDPASDTVPPILVWCLAPAVAPTGTLGSDGHPARGGFLPPVALPRRMWAGGELVLHAPIRIGDTVRRSSVVTDVRLKRGRTGPLCLVSVRHEYRVEDVLAITEDQDIVYREMDAVKPEVLPVAEAIAPTPADETRKIEASPVLLFRYSALTFNSHRIHYDRLYCQAEEGYPGLVVHGPLQATQLYLLAHARSGRWPRRFRFRGVRPLFDGMMTANARDEEDRMSLFCADGEGRVTMSAEAFW